MNNEETIVCDVCKGEIFEMVRRWKLDRHYYPDDFIDYLVCLKCRNEINIEGLKQSIIEDDDIFSRARWNQYYREED